MTRDRKSPTPITVSEAYGLGKRQPELDFVDVNLNGDTPLFVDPLAIAKRTDDWSIGCHQALVTYFQRAVDLIKDGKDTQAKALLSHLNEPNETRLGLSRGAPQGAGLGTQQSMDLFTAFKGSAAVASGTIKSLDECELMIPGIGWDKVSDLTTNVIRHHLVQYTQNQCELLGLQTEDMALPPQFDEERLEWMSSYAQLPAFEGKPVLLVPKSIARRSVSSVGSNYYYNQFVLKFLKAEAEAGMTGLGKSLARHVMEFKNGRRRATKASLKSAFPMTKDYLYRFSIQHPEVLTSYRMYRENLEDKGAARVSDRELEIKLAEELPLGLAAIAPGSQDATRYHHLMIGVVELLFYPMLIHPRKEREVNDGRKRIDITMENDAAAGIFWRLRTQYGYQVAHIVIECKNYNDDPGNYELDQLIGRFADHRTKVGILLLRQVNNWKRLISRCQDAHKSRQGIIVVLDDARIKTLLEVVQSDRGKLDEKLSEYVTEITMS